ncbi:MAG: hypothetical protein ACI9EF_001951 [Pseudohongiellaceae bacterium]|jgi:hypothetical protein
MAVGAQGNDGAHSSVNKDIGGVWVVFFNPDGTVAAESNISDTAENFGGHLVNQDAFGFSSAAVGDLNGDGNADLMVGHVFNENGGFDSGGLYSVMLDGSGQVLSQLEIANGKGGFTGVFEDVDEMGRSLAAIGNLDGDGVVDVAGGAFGSSDGAPIAGSLWIFFMNTDGSVRDQQKISATSGGFGGNLDFGSRFGSAIAPLGDIDGDGVIDLAVGASRGPLFNVGASRVFILFMNRDGTVKSELDIGEGLGGFSGAISDGDRFGMSLHNMGDFDGDGVVELSVGANGDDDGGFDRGAVYILFLNGKATMQWRSVFPGTAGTLGVPVLSGDGLAVADTRAEVHLYNALPNSLAHVFIGFAPTYLIFKGGILHTLPDILFSGLPVDGMGQLNLPFIWPVGIPVGAEVHFQTWVTDAGGPDGFAGTNGLIVSGDG